MTPHSFVLLALLAAPAAHPEATLGDGWKLTLDAQLRPRATFDTGRDFSDEVGDNHEYVTQRARLGVTLADADGLSFVLRVQDVRVWGEEDNTTDFQANGFDVHEAYGAMVFGETVRVRVGRQEIAFDNERLVGPLNWTQRARSFDGGRLTLTGPGWDADAFGTVIVESDKDKDGNVPSGRNGGTIFGGLHGHYHVSDALDVNLASYMRRNKTTEERRHTLGTYVTGAVSGFRYAVDGYYQMGDLDDEDISAYMAGLRAGYEMADGPKLGFTLIADYLSGDGKPTGVFDTLYATNHPFYGEMDFFTDIPAHTFGHGLIDLGGRLSAKPHDAVTTSLAYHMLQTVEATPLDEKLLGHEADLRVDWKALPHFGVYALYGVFLSGPAFTENPTSVAGDYELEHQVYVTTDLTF